MRQARIEDAVAIYALLTGRMRLAANRPTTAVDPAKTLLIINRSIMAGTCWVAVRGRELVGSLGCVVNPHWYSSTPVLINLWMWLNEEARSFKTARGFLVQAKEKAKELGLSLEIGMDSGVDVDRKRRFYDRLGFREIGAYYVEAQHG